jgi:hypothetical protein
MKMLSVLQRIVENEGRTAIMAVEWLLQVRAQQEKNRVKTRTLQKPKHVAQLSFQRSKDLPPAGVKYDPPAQFLLTSLRLRHPPDFHFWVILIRL